MNSSNEENYQILENETDLISACIDLFPLMYQFTIDKLDNENFDNWFNLIVVFSVYFKCKEIIESDVDQNLIKYVNVKKFLKLIVNSDEKKNEIDNYCTTVMALIYRFAYSIGYDLEKLKRRHDLYKLILSSEEIKNFGNKFNLIYDSNELDKFNSTFFLFKMNEDKQSTGINSLVIKNIKYKILRTDYSNTISHFKLHFQILIPINFNYNSIEDNLTNLISNLMDEIDILDDKSNKRKHEEIISNTKYQKIESELVELNSSTNLTSKSNLKQSTNLLSNSEEIYELAQISSISKYKNSILRLDCGTSSLKKSEDNLRSSIYEKSELAIKIPKQSADHFPKSVLNFIEQRQKAVKLKKNSLQQKNPFLQLPGMLQSTSTISTSSQTISIFSNQQEITNSTSQKSYNPKFMDKEFNLWIKHFNLLNELLEHRENWSAIVNQSRSSINLSILMRKILENQRENFLKQKKIIEDKFKILDDLSERNTVGGVQYVKCLSKEQENQIKDEMVKLHDKQKSLIDDSSLQFLSISTEVFLYLQELYLNLIKEDSRRQKDFEIILKERTRCLKEQWFAIKSQIKYVDEQLEILKNLKSGENFAQESICKELAQLKMIKDKKEQESPKETLE